MNIPLSSPDITAKEINAVIAVLKTPHLSLGPKLSEFEQKFAEYIDVKYAIAVNSGTSALHLCVKALGIKDGDEVITTPFSFISSANCMLFERATPVFVDIREDNFNIDESKIEKAITKKTKAILPVHIFGYPCEMDKIRKIAKKYKLAVIEDACEAIGAKYKGKSIGRFGDCGVFAFYPNKQITTGEGGMIVTNNSQIASICRSLRNQGRDHGMAWLAHTRIGYNYRISDINCALGIAQLSRINEILCKRKKIQEMYNKKLGGIDDIILPAHDDLGITRSYFVYVIRLKEYFSQKQRDNIIVKLKEYGIACNSYFPAIHFQPFYTKTFGYKKGDFPVTEKISGLTIALPFFNNISDKQVDFIVKKLKKVIREVKK
ncbi:MAG: DegT/DnrJ/EryC1/StrS family aminotransferase [Candidatus Omnitrophica bacterium]|nr:DegT/DnrJ/EryC1/StrS family aminotransferase [Candidatus Omnitrophota bacterium]MBU3929178.1 DegT/DnrJ/EryC1/StrS family aminotransferase [bacterium]